MTINELIEKYPQIEEIEGLEDALDEWGDGCYDEGYEDGCASQEGVCH